MPMNEVIFARRRALGWTQEQLAERLGVTAPAVNKWEKGVTCPDLMLLCPLARLLGVDPNELLCFHAELTEEEIARCLEELRATFEQGGLEAGFALARARMREYPRCAPLAERLSLFLNGALLLSDASEEARAAHASELARWYGELLDCADGEIRARAALMLAGLRLQERDFDEVERLLERIPDRPTADARLMREALLIAKGELNEAGRLAAESALRAAGDLQAKLTRLLEVELQQKNFERAEALASMLRALNDVLGLWAYHAPAAQLLVALARRDAPRSVALLRELLEAALTPWEASASPAFARLGGRAPQQKTLCRTAEALLGALERDEDYAFLRGEGACASLVAEYRARIADLMRGEARG